MLNPNSTFVGEYGDVKTRAQIADQVNGDLSLIHVDETVSSDDDRLTDEVCQRYVNIVVGSDSELEEVAHLLAMMGFIS